MVVRCRPKTHGTSGPSVYVVAGEPVEGVPVELLGDGRVATTDEHGLAELVAYLELADRSPKTLIDESVEDQIRWHGPDRSGRERLRQVSLPRVIFVR